MSVVQSFLPFDSSSVANYKAWAQGIGSTLSTIGWSKTSDSYGVTWANVAFPPVSFSVSSSKTIPVKNLIGSGAWSGGTSYIGTTSAGSTNNMVTSGGLTYLCVANTQITLTQVIQSTATSSTTTAVGNNSGGVTAYTWSVAGGAANAYLGYIFTVTGYANSANNGTFICTASSATTLTLANSSGVAVTANGTAASVNTSSTVVGTSGLFTDNLMVGQSFVIAGFASSSGANNGTFTCVASHSVTSTAYMGYSNSSGLNETHAGTMTANTAPASSTMTSAGLGGFWYAYNYEVWVSNGPLSAISPIYLKIVYGGTSTGVGPGIIFAIGTACNGAGVITGNYIDPGIQGYAEYNLTTNSAGTGATTYECDFSGDADNFRMIMWRTSSAACSALVIDRGRDLYGSGLATYWTACWSYNLSGARTEAYQQTIFQAGAGNRGGYTNGNGWIIPFFIGSNTTVNTGNSNGQIPALPIFPVVGFLGNPLLGAVMFKNGDVAEGAFINVVFFGTSHTYLCSKQSNVAVIDPNGQGALGILWQ